MFNAQRCLGALARALDSPMPVSSKGGDIPQPSLMGNIRWLPIVASVRSMLPPSVTVGRDIAARRLTMCGNHGLALQLT
jgi:hypothetical protein